MTIYPFEIVRAILGDSVENYGNESNRIKQLHAKPFVICFIRYCNKPATAIVDNCSGCVVDKPVENAKQGYFCPIFEKAVIACTVRNRLARS